MALADLPMIWVARLIFSLLPEKDNLVLSMDRTNWKFGDKNINILMLGVSYKNVAFPILFKMLDKIGLRIVQDFMQKNPNVDFEELLKLKEENVFKQSAYKPGK